MLWMFTLAAGILVVLACAVRILLRPDRDPSSRAAWLVLLFALPGVGVVAYLLLGETSIGRKRAARAHKVFEGLPRPTVLDGWEATEEDAKPGYDVEPLFHVGRSISGYDVVGGNRATLMHDSDGAIDSMVADIDASTAHVHLMFYIWLPDNNGLKMAGALKRAVARGVTVRAMVDDLGSRDLIRSEHWKDMQDAGVRLARALPIGNPFARMLNGRIDLRNHRKILVIDNRITYCGSQNCADPAFLPKAKYAPWVDAVMRFEGPVARQNQHLFASDWMSNNDEDIRGVLQEPLEEAASGFPAQVVASGPTFRRSAMPEMFTSCIHAARRKLVVTTPYYVPNQMLQAAFCTAAARGVDTTIIFPQRNDDFAVAGTSRSYYADLLTAGVKVYEFKPGLLHTKSMTIDDDITLIGSANMDKRSFDLNYENNILFQDAELTATMRSRQMQYLGDSVEITLDEVLAWGWSKRLWNNLLGVVGPVL